LIVLVAAISKPATTKNYLLYLNFVIVELRSGTLVVSKCECTWPDDEPTNRKIRPMSTAKFTIAIAMLSILTTGCSTITGGGTSQSVSVQTLAADGQDVESAKCEMTNDEGTWFVTTPGSSVVRRSNKDLQVICNKVGLDVGTANVVSRTTGNMFANILLGGGIGAIVDHNNGSAYEYPGLIKIVMGRMNQKIENKPSTAPAATTASK
jgi:hypothetical protein